MRLNIVFILLSLIITGNTLSGQKAPKKITISGSVVDEKNNPVPDAFIMIDGKLTGTTTDLKGSYKVKVSNDSYKIVIYTLMSGGAEELIGGRTTINFILNLSGSQQKEKSQKTVSDEEMNKTIPGSKISNTNKNFGAYRDIYELIQGELPTVIVEGKTVKIPGAVSLQWSTEPLFVVDGKEVTTISDIDPSFVKSIQVLKGSSASIYGMKGANGVILINLLGSKNNNIVK